MTRRTATMIPPPTKGATRQTERKLISIITVFWNGRGEVQRFFSALEHARDKLSFDLEVIAVDNASTDRTADAIEAEYPWVNVVRNDENSGFALGCNIGMARAKGDFILLLNPDCEANAGALAGMAEFLDRNHRAGAVGCELLHGDGLPQNSYHHEPSWWSYWGTHSLASPLLLKIRKLFFRVVPQRRVPRRVDWLMGACLMVPRAVYEQVGGLDPNYFMYSEDADWCRRIRDAGYAVVHHPRWSIIHHHGTSARRRPEFTFRRLYRSLLMYSNKYQPGVRSIPLRAAIVLDMVLRLPIHLLLGQKDRIDSVRAVLRMYLGNEIGE